MGGNAILRASVDHALCVRASPGDALEIPLYETEDGSLYPNAPLASASTRLEVSARVLEIPCWTRVDVASVDMPRVAQLARNLEGEHVFAILEGRFARLNGHPIEMSEHEFLRPFFDASNGWIRIDKHPTSRPRVFVQAWLVDILDVKRGLPRPVSTSNAPPSRRSGR